MKLFFSEHKVIQCTINDLDSYENVESILAEEVSENEVVLAYANNNWIGCGLIYPNIKNINFDDLDVLTPKVFLLKKDDKNLKFLKKFGDTLFEYVEYEKEVMGIINYGSF